MTPTCFCIFWKFWEIPNIFFHKLHLGQQNFSNPIILNCPRMQIKPINNVSKLSSCQSNQDRSWFCKRPFTDLLLRTAAKSVDLMGSQHIIPLQPESRGVFTASAAILSEPDLIDELNLTLKCLSFQNDSIKEAFLEVTGYGEEKSIWIRRQQHSNFQSKFIQ